MVKVMITRRIKPGKIKELMGYLNQLRTGAIHQSGWVSAEFLYSQDDRRKMVVVCTWESKRQWERWRDDPVRKTLENKIERFLVEPATYETFSYRSPKRAA
ncbi:MAG: antibiotic biosynthesis monooxygenase [Proteobacteria bacterium]|nr:antibiotic biosynthesis monooxygenase [Pseudomonadota bacterium]